MQRGGAMIWVIPFKVEIIHLKCNFMGWIVIYVLYNGWV
jgi:hypothetical protein